MDRDPKRLTDRQLLEAIYNDLSNRVQSVGTQVAGLTQEVRALRDEHEATARRVDEGISTQRRTTAAVQSCEAAVRALDRHNSALTDELARRVTDIERRIAA
jgi:hypothetical protein